MKNFFNSIVFLIILVCGVGITSCQKHDINPMIAVYSEWKTLGRPWKDSNAFDIGNKTVVNYVDASLLTSDLLGNIEKTSNIDPCIKIFIRYKDGGGNKQVYSVQGRNPGPNNGSTKYILEPNKIILASIGELDAISKNPLPAYIWSADAEFRYVIVSNPDKPEAFSNDYSTFCKALNIAE